MKNLWISIFCITTTYAASHFVETIAPDTLRPPIGRAATVESSLLPSDGQEAFHPSVASTITPLLSPLKTLTSSKSKYQASAEKHAQHFISHQKSWFWWAAPKQPVTLEELRTTLQSFRQIRPWTQEAEAVIDAICSQLHHHSISKKSTQYAIAELLYRVRPRYSFDVGHFQGTRFEVLGLDCILELPLSKANQHIAELIILFHHSGMIDTEKECIKIHSPQIFSETMLGLQAPPIIHNIDMTTYMPTNFLLRTNDTVTVDTLLGPTQYTPLPVLSLPKKRPNQCAQSVMQHALQKHPFQNLYQPHLSFEVLQMILAQFRQIRPWDAEAAPVIDTICRHIQCSKADQGQHNNNQRIMASMLYNLRPRCHRHVSPITHFNGVQCTFNVFNEQRVYTTGYMHVQDLTEDVRTILLSTLWMATQGQATSVDKLPQYYNSDVLTKLILSVIAICCPQSVRYTNDHTIIPPSLLFEKNDVRLIDLADL